MVLVAVQLFVPGLYLPPVLKKLLPSYPAPDDHFAASPDCRVNVSGRGRVGVLVAVQLSVLGLYLPPVLKEVPRMLRPRRSFHCRSRLPCERLGQRGH